MNAKTLFRLIGTWLLKLLWALCTWMFRLLGKLLLFALWVFFELLAHISTAIATFLKTKITSTH
jgi:hypothetical protein